MAVNSLGAVITVILPKTPAMVDAPLHKKAGSPEYSEPPTEFTHNQLRDLMTR